MELQLDAVREELSGLWDWTRAQFWMTTAQTAAREGSWETACRRLLRLVDPLGSSPTGSGAWTQLAVQALEAAVRAKSPSLVTEAANRILDNAWPSPASPHELVGVLRTADELDALACGQRLGELVDRRYPKFGWGPYAAAHFAERIAMQTDRSPGDPTTAIDRFDRAAVLFEKSHMERAAVHSRLRSATWRMTATPQTDRARAMLKTVDADRLEPAERHWYALAQAHSPFWLERVRAADYVGDEFDRNTSNELPGVIAIAETLFTHLPVQLAAAEADRLRDLSASFGGEARWELEAQIRGREAVEPHADTALDEIDAETAKELEQEALSLDGFSALVAAWNGRSTPDRPRDPVAAAVVEVLLADDETRPDALSALVEQMDRCREGRRLRPVALVFGRVATWDGANDDFAPLLTKLAASYARSAPRPGYGFLNLAAVLFDAGLWEAGARITRRALDEGEGDEPERLDAAVARSMQWAVRDGSDREMIEWLELGERRFAEAEA